MCYFKVNPSPNVQQFMEEIGLDFRGKMKRVATLGFYTQQVVIFVMASYFP